MKEKYFQKIKDNLIVYNKNTKTIDKLKYIFLIISLYLFIFQYFLQEYISIFNYWDEFYAILFFPLIAVKLFKMKKNGEKIELKKDDKIILICSILIILIGLAGNIIYKYQNIFIVPQEILLVFKFLLSFYTTKMLFCNLEIFQNEKIANYSKILTVFFTILIILDYIFNLFPHEIRYGIKTEQLFFGRQTTLAAVMVINLAILLYTSKSKNKRIYVILNLLIIASTLRAKALAMVAVFCILYYWLIKKNKNINTKLIIIMILTSLILASQQILYYFITEPNTARSALLQTSFIIANEHFPIGTGFATFGTHLSGEFYSGIYEKYKIENIYGLTEGKTNFISDNFWPAIIGEFGYLGLIIYCVILIVVYKKIHSKYNENKLVYLVALIPFLYLLICSTAESAFLHTISVPMFFVISLAVNLNAKNLNKEETKMQKKINENIILIDFPKIENWKFKNGLNIETGMEWEEVEKISNKSRKNKFYNIVRYYKYFSFPFNIFLNRKKYKNIIAWQQFYGLIYAFYCRLFKCKKVNNLIIMTFIYKEKNGLIGKLYKKFIKYSIGNEYVDSIVCFSKEEINYYCDIFKECKDKFNLSQLGIEKINVTEKNNIKEKTILSCGRSNRDYKFLYNALKNTDYKLDIISDMCSIPNCKNITIHNDIHGQAFFEMLNKCYIVVIPLESKKISSGQLVCLQAMQLGKPVICTESDTIKDYIQDGENGFIIKKEKDQLINIIEKLFNDKELYNSISNNEIKFFEENCSMNAFGKQIGNIYNSNCKK